MFVTLASANETAKRMIVFKRLILQVFIPTLCVLVPVCVHVYMRTWVGVNLQSYAHTCVMCACAYVCTHFQLKMADRWSHARCVFRSVVHLPVSGLLAWVGLSVCRVAMGLLGPVVGVCFEFWLVVLVR